MEKSDSFEDVNRFKELHSLLDRGEFTEVISSIDSRSATQEQDLVLKAFALLQKGHFDASEKLCERLLTSDSRWIKTQVYRTLSAIKWNNGLVSEGVELAEKSLDLLADLQPRSYQEKKITASVLHNYGTVKVEIGELISAEKQLTRSIAISKEIGDEVRKATSAVNLANIYHKQGKLYEALTLSHEGLSTFERSNNEAATAWIVGNIGLIHAQRGEDKIAIDCIMKCLELEKKVGNPMRIAETYPDLIRILLRSNRIDEAKEKLTELRIIVGNDKKLHHLVQFSQAMILKNENRMVDKAEAIKLFEWYLKSDYKTQEFEIQTRFHLCDLLYDEFIMYSNPEVHAEIREHIDIVYEDTQANFMIPDLIKTLILKSKILLAEYKFEEADKILEQAIMLGEENGIDYLRKQAVLEQELIHDSMGEWETMLERGSSLRERAEKTNLKKYISEVLRLISDY
ncbi:MAG: tetratricopeptide repeat protein [Candidatus Heimdallarchaeota archaeon]|nr:tetratricopeptide repeat protein [Candidatus Heimdallarchaeota archaeon]